MDGYNKKVQAHDSEAIFGSGDMRNFAKCGAKGRFGKKVPQKSKVKCHKNKK